jgi:hypothetical protein
MIESNVSPFQIYKVDFSNVYGVDRMILYDPRSSVVGIAMFDLEGVEKAIAEFKNNRKGR